MAEQLSTDDVRKVAHLARLKLSDQDVERFTGQLADILQYVEQLKEVDTDAVEPLVHAVELTNVLRDDVPRASLPRDAALSNAPAADGAYFLVPPILENA